MGCIGDDARAWSLPRRITLPAAGPLPEDCLYIGAGSKALKLPASTWARFLVTGPGMNRRSTVELYEASLRQDVSAVAELAGLEGYRLACHCTSQQPCHGDVLI